MLPRQRGSSWSIISQSLNLLLVKNGAQVHCKVFAVFFLAGKINDVIFQIERNDAVVGSCQLVGDVQESCLVLELEHVHRSPPAPVALFGFNGFSKTTILEMALSAKGVESGEVVAVVEIAGWTAIFAVGSLVGNFGKTTGDDFEAEDFFFGEGFRRVFSELLALLSRYFEPKFLHRLSCKRRIPNTAGLGSRPTKNNNQILA